MPEQTTAETSYVAIEELKYHKMTAKIYDKIRHKIKNKDEVRYGTSKAQSTAAFLEMHKQDLLEKKQGFEKFLETTNKENLNFNAQPFLTADNAKSTKKIEYGSNRLYSKNRPELAEIRKTLIKDIQKKIDETVISINRVESMKKIVDELSKIMEKASRIDIDDVPHIMLAESDYDCLISMQNIIANEITMVSDLVLVKKKQDIEDIDENFFRWVL